MTYTNIVGSIENQGVNGDLAPDRRFNEENNGCSRAL